jgi:hypothetical protein
LELAQFCQVNLILTIAPELSGVSHELVWKLPSERERTAVSVAVRVVL